MRQRVFIAVLVLITGTAVAQVPLVGGGGASLADIEHTPTMITVVLGDSGAEDANLRVWEVHSGHMTVVTTEGARKHYMFSDIQEIRVQGGVVTVEEYQPRTNLGLDAEQVEAVRRAIERGAQIFKESNANQPLKMRAASLVIVGGGEDAAAEARAYLQGLAGSNDVPSALDAAYAQYLAGEKVRPEIVSSGIESGNPRVRIDAAYLAGLTQNHVADSLLFKMVQDRAKEYSAPAAGALALLGEREVLPSLLGMLAGTNETKANAAKFGLVLLGGGDVATQMKILLGETQGEARLRVVEVLCRLGDPDGKKLLRREMSIPTRKYEAALLLAPLGDVKAMEVLRARIAQKFEADDEEALLWRADSAAALLAGNDRTMLGVLMELLRSEFPSVQRRVYKNIIDLDKRSLLSVALPGVGNKKKPDIAMTACETVIALTDEEFRQRLLLRDMQATAKPLSTATALSQDSFAPGTAGAGPGGAGLAGSAPERKEAAAQGSSRGRVAARETAREEASERGVAESQDDVSADLEQARSPDGTVIVRVKNKLQNGITLKTLTGPPVLMTIGVDESRQTRMKLGTFGVVVVAQGSLPGEGQEQMALHMAGLGLAGSATFFDASDNCCGGAFVAQLGGAAKWTISEKNGSIHVDQEAR